MAFFMSYGTFTPVKRSPELARCAQNRDVVEAKLKRAKDNSDCGALAAKRVNFQNPRGSIYGLWRDDAYGRLYYVVYSYGKYYPIYAWDEEAGLWFRNTETGSVTTTNHIREARPRDNLPKHPLTYSDMEYLSVYGLVELIASKANLYSARPEGVDPVEWLPVAAQPFIRDPDLPAMLRPPGLPHELDLGMGREKKQQAELAWEALSGMGWHPCTLGEWSWASGRWERKVLRLTTPTNAHREILYGKNLKPVAGIRQGKPVVKFIHPINEGKDKPVYYPVWIEFQTKAEAREACRAIDTMRRIHLFNEAA